MKHIVDDVRIKEIKELSPPAHILREFPASEPAAAATYEARAAIHRILHGSDDRLLVVIGPCSIHDYDAAMEYARRLKGERDRLGADLQIVMRVYFEKPRTTVGWKGLINDPRLDGPAPPSSSTPSPRNTPPTSSAGAPSARAPPSRRCTASWPRVCRARSVSRTALTATSRSPSTPSRPPPPPTISSR
jgi:DAHP synthetase I family